VWRTTLALDFVGFSQLTATNHILIKNETKNTKMRAQ
jgi:hypothetical protein